MNKRPAVVSGFHSEAAIARIVLNWTSLGFDPLIDHYRVHGLAGQHESVRPGPDNLVGKTVYPRFVHADRDPAGETWTYTVVAVSAAGLLSEPSAQFRASSQASVTTTGRKVATIGSFDAKTLEHRFAPAGYAQIPVAYPDAVIDYVDGTDTPASDWPYLLPGPGDAWAGLKVYRARWTFEATAAVHDVALWLVDSTRLGGELQILVNGAALTSFALEKGATKGSREGDATVKGTTLVRSYYEFEVPAGRLRDGSNTVELVLTKGGWVAWDAVGLFARS